MHHVIIGNGPAGVIAAETIRKHRQADPITLIGDEPEPPYSRMAIPYLLIGDIPEAGTYLRKAKDHFSGRRIELVRASARRIDAKAKAVMLDTGRTLAYDRLLLATGSRPARPPIPGIDLPNILSCWTLKDARMIMDAVKPGARVLLMGAGFIGCIIMEAVASRAAELTLVEMGERMVPRMMTEGAGRLIKRWCEARGVRILTGTRVVAIEKAPSGAMRAQLGGGNALEVDVIISATGIKPSVGCLDGSGVKLGSAGGIVVDDRMQTNVPDIYAAGDCTEAAEFDTGKIIVNAIQPNAADQARVGALNMAGLATRSPGSLQINVLATFGLVSSSFGQWQGADGGEHIELNDEASSKYIRLEFKDDVLIGANSVGLTEHVGVIRGLIQSRTRLGRAWKARLLADPLELTDAYLARAQAAA